MEPLLCSQVQAAGLALQSVTDGRFRGVSLPGGTPLVVQGPVALVLERVTDALKLVVEPGDVLHAMVTSLEEEAARCTGLRVNSIIDEVQDIPGAKSVSVAIASKPDGSLATIFYDGAGSVANTGVSSLRKGVIGVPMLHIQGINIDTSAQTAQLALICSAWHDRA